jgi:hypothetical protein
MFEHKSEIPSYFAEFDLAPFAAEVAALCRAALAFEAAEQAGAALQLGGHACTFSVARLAGAPVLPERRVAG